jgi:hypothetical protein
MLEKICALPILRWNYIGENKAVQHIGPMAQDFYRLFGVGNDSLGITTIDPAGLALLGIQELNKKLEKENAALKEQIVELKIALAKTEKQDTEVARKTSEFSKEIEQSKQEIEQLKKLIYSMAASASKN